MYGTFNLYVNQLYAPTKILFTAGNKNRSAAKYMYSRFFTIFGNKQQSSCNQLAILIVGIENVFS